MNEHQLIKKDIIIEAFNKKDPIVKKYLRAYKIRSFLEPAFEKEIERIKNE